MKEDWIECKLGEILNIERGGSPRPIKEFITNDENGINWIKISDATNSGKYILKTIQKIKPTGLKNSREVFPGDLLLSNSMSFGKPYIMGINGAIHDGWLVIRDNKFLDKNYLFYALASPITYNQFSQNAKGSTVKNLNIEIVREVTIKVNPLPIQKGIVKKIEELFSSLDSGIADLKKAQEQLVIYRQAVLKKAFEGELNDIKIELQNDILKNVVTFSQGMQVPVNEQRTEPGINDCRFLRIIDFTQGKDDPRYVVKPDQKYHVNKNDISMVRYGASTGFICTNLEGVIANNLFKITPKKEIESRYLYYFFKSPIIIQTINRLIKGAAMPAISFGLLNIIEINYPKEKIEQIKIVREIESRLSVCDKVEESLKESLEKAKALRQSILKKAFEGKLLSSEELAKCKADKDYEPASVLLERIKKEKNKKL